MPEPSTQPRPTWSRLVLIGLIAGGSAALLVVVARSILARFVRSDMVAMAFMFPVLITIGLALVPIGKLLSRRWLKGAPPRVTGWAVAMPMVLGFILTSVGTSHGARWLLLSFPGAIAPVVFSNAFVYGGYFLFRGLNGQRQGDSLHCPKCDYELGMSEQDAPLLCPECGHLWLGCWVKGKFVRSNRRVWTGVALILVPVLLLTTWFTPMGGSIVRTLPTGAIITLASIDSWGKNTTAWDEIGKRPLTAEQEATLAARLMNARLDSDYLYGPRSVWLEAAVLHGGVSGPLPQALRDRYLAEVLEPHIEMPDHVTMGESVPIRIAVRYRASGSPNWAYIRIDDLHVDSSNIDISYWQMGGSSTWLYGLQMNEDGPRIRTSLTESTLSTLPLLDTSTPGTRRISCRLSTCLAPRGPAPGPGVTPLLTTSITIEKTVFVDER